MSLGTQKKTKNKTVCLANSAENDFHYFFSLSWLNNYILENSLSLSLSQPPPPKKNKYFLKRNNVCIKKKKITEKKQTIFAFNEKIPVIWKILSFPHEDNNRIK